jgi:hypothetical protein
MTRNDEETLERMTKVKQEIARLSDSLDARQEEAVKLDPHVQEIVAEIADKFLVDDKGQPENGPIYWYNSQAVVRIGDIVTLIPVECMDSEKIFGPKPPREVAA